MTSGDEPTASIKTESFDRDPAWEGLNNHIVPDKAPTIAQAFGYRRSQNAGGGAGEMGGTVWRSSKPAFYGKKIETRTLDDKLLASGAFCLTATSAGSGLFFGWFAEKQPGGGRPLNSLGWFLDAENSGARLYVNLVTGTNRSHGEFVTPFRRGEKILPLLPDGSRHTWSIVYDPAAASGNGSLQFVLDGAAAVVADLPPGFKDDETAFDHFGLMNVHKSGGPLTVFMDDLEVDGQAEDFNRDPGWDAAGNQTTYEDRELTGAHDYGFSQTHRAGGSPGELGGIVWRVEEPVSWYADRVGPLDMDRPLVARGKVSFAVGAPDSGVCLGWFNSATRNQAATELSNFLGVYIEGPSRVGHYFRPVVATADGTRRDPVDGPIIIPDGQPRTWELRYDPLANGGAGEIEVTLDDKSFRFPLQPGDKERGATFDRFGLLTSRSGGGQVKVYLDDLEYTAR